ncbi:DUF2976 domain-containing protein [Vibrio crassostreae]|uniref:DUF2976 domain-containing protein n=1 Tax=Vibrio crassostreae TaxID=246167 RepID=UPI001B312E9B|nr:DUF2976 domain-containing protein [Vibrio crassostreae]
MNILQRFKIGFYRKRRSLSKYLTALSIAITSNAYAALPAPVSDQLTDGDFFDWLGLQIDKLYKLITESTAMFSLFVVGAYAVYTFVQILRGKAEWSDLGLAIAGGAFVLVVVFFLFGEGGKI